MKDYTKYNFAAIIGTKVEITTKNGRTVKGTLIDFNFNLVKAPIYIHESGACIATIPLAEIKSLSAGITIESMNAKQLRKHFQCGRYDEVVLRGDDYVCVYEWHPDDKYDVRKGTSIHEYVDCTDWGWPRRDADEKSENRAIAAEEEAGEKHACKECVHYFDLTYHCYNLAHIKLCDGDDKACEEFSPNPFKEDK